MRDRSACDDAEQVEQVVAAGALRHGLRHRQQEAEQRREEYGNAERERREEERTLKELMERHPGLKEAYERLEIMKALTLEEEKKNA